LWQPRRLVRVVVATTSLGPAREQLPHASTVPPASPGTRRRDICHPGPGDLVDGKGPQSGLGTASLTLYFAVTYTIQRFILQAKAQRIADGSHQDVGDRGTRTRSW
jgi:hypothetical protein